MDSLCRVCIGRTAKYTLLNTKIEKSSNLTFFDFLNKCTSLSARESDKLPQSLCSICTHSVKTFYSFVKLAEKSDIILREALKNPMATERYNDNTEFSCEEITITNGKIEEGSEDFNKEDSFHCQPSTNATGSSLNILDIVKEEPRLSESPSSVAEINDSDEFNSNSDHPEYIEEPDYVLSCTDDHLASIDSDSEDGVSVSSMKRRSVKSEDETSQSNIFSKVHCISSNVKKKTGKDIIKEEASDAQSICHADRLSGNREISCEEITIKSEKIEEGFAYFNKEDTFHCQTSTNVAGSSLYLLDIVKEETRVSESASVVVKVNESDEFQSDLDHPEGSIEEPDDILSCLAGHLTSIHAEYSDSEDDVPISLLKRRLVKNEDETDSQSTKIKCEDHFRIGHSSRNQVSRDVAEDALLKPQLRGHTKNTYKCKECDMVFNGKEELRTHCQNQACEDKPECNICGRKFNRRQYIHYHLVTHDAKKKYKCSICGKDFKHASTHWNHMRIHSGEKPFECKICSKRFKGKSHLRRHRESHSGVTKKCSQCDKEFKYAKGLRRHMKWHTNPKPYKCETCGRLFADKRGHIRHMGVCNPAGNSNEETHQKGLMKKTCKECDMVFNDKEEFEAHCRSHGCRDKHECNICGKKFARQQYLQYHLVIHEENNKYECSICGKCFKRPSCRRRHMRIHSEGKLIECEICGKKFRGTFNLKRHMENHSGIMKKCAQCDKEFKNNNSLRTHMKRHNNPKPFKCENCGKLFGRKFTYTRHMETCKPVDNSNEETITIEELSFHSEGSNS